MFHFGVNSFHASTQFLKNIFLSFSRLSFVKNIFHISKYSFLIQSCRIFSISRFLIFIKRILGETSLTHPKTPKNPWMYECFALNVWVCLHHWIAFEEGRIALTHSNVRLGVLVSQPKWNSAGSFFVIYKNCSRNSPSGNFYMSNVNSQFFFLKAFVRDK